MNSISLESPILRAFRSMEDTLKNFFEKSLKKLLTTDEESGKIIKLLRKNGSEKRTLITK